MSDAIPIRRRARAFWTASKATGRSPGNVASHEFFRRPRRRSGKRDAARYGVGRAREGAFEALICVTCVWTSGMISAQLPEAECGEADVAASKSPRWTSRTRTSPTCARLELGMRCRACVCVWCICTDPCNVLPCHAMPCHAMPCHAMPCHAMPCHAMPCHAMPCGSLTVK